MTTIVIAAPDHEGVIELQSPLSAERTSYLIQWALNHEAELVDQRDTQGNVIDRQD